MEVEVKYPLKNPEEVINRLNSIAKKDKIEEFQKDIYFELNSKLLRIRESKSGNFISFKERIDDISCNNYSTKIRDIEPMKIILNKIGFKEMKIIEKTRSTWLYKDFEIAIDKLDKFGYFIEIEAHDKKDFSLVLKEINAEIESQNFEGYSKLQ